MKRLFSIRFLVTVLCLVLALAVFASCDSGSSGGGETTAGNGETSGNGETTGGGDTNGGDESQNGSDTGAGTDTETITVSNYVIITSQTADDNINKAALILLEAVKEYTGVDVSFKTDYDSANADACEILIGSTNREESASALSELNGQNGYVVKKVGNKIVLNASSTSLLDEAANYLINTYISNGSNGTFEIEKDLCYANGNLGGISLLNDKNVFQYSLVYSQDVDTKKDMRDETNEYYNGGVDYIYSYILKVWEELMDKFDTDVVVDTDFGTAKDTNLEILVGSTNRPETATFLQDLAPNEYGYGVVGNKLVIAGWSELTTGEAIDLFLEEYKNYLVENGSVSNLVMIEGEKSTATYDKWNMDIPMYEGGDFQGAIDLLDDGYELYYLETDADEFRAYRSKLEGAGYELYQENQIGDNLFATYYGPKMMVHTYYVAYNNAVRVIAESVRTAIPPQLEDPNMGEKITDTSFTLMDLDEGVQNFGNAFIITLEDGSFIIHDGGGDASKGDKGTRERDELYNLLKYLQKRAGGEGDIVIAAWIISHQHWDHFKNTYDMIKEYYSEDVVLEKIIYNIGAETTRYNSMNPGTYLESGVFEQISTWTSAELIKMHTGQKIQIRNLNIEVIYTVDDIYPEHIVKFNNSAFITRFDIGEGENKQRLTILGDVEEVGSKILCDMYGDELKSDIMQVAHHGYGGSIDLYALLEPTFVLWPKDQKAVDVQKNGSGYYPGINQSLINQSNVKVIVVADNGHQIIDLPMVGSYSSNKWNAEDFVETIPRIDGR